MRRDKISFYYAYLSVCFSGIVEPSLFPAVGDLEYVLEVEFESCQEREMEAAVGLNRKFTTAPATSVCIKQRTRTFLYGTQRTFIYEL